METLIVTPCSAGIPGSRAAWSGLPKCASTAAPAPAPAPPGGRRVRQRQPRGAALGRGRDPAPPQRPPKALDQLQLKHAFGENKNHSNQIVTLRFIVQPSIS
ncbi:neuropeptide Y receptor type 5 isoform X2 [Empidonax traillii]|uniref:neuropeptide Y receptor type 5 isoform X2 n=1 Tax=Empidonax traillii TaxID=164674 RepID=UPI000FFD3ED9|nr:neuropeptide Y receptor type 5 isoform X2 [Empidonax traillii]